MLKNHYYEPPVPLEAGCDEAGRGCLAGPVYAAAVILPPDYANDRLNDSKKLTERQRYELREVIIRDALCWAVASCSAKEIDQMNILRASIEAMHRALNRLNMRPQAIIVDGNRFTPWTDPDTGHRPPYTTIVKGDSQYMSIAAASILAKTYRDDYMLKMARRYTRYSWAQNKGYPTKQHRDAIAQYGVTPQHRRTFTMMSRQQTDMQLELPFGQDDE
jgi:ribonuclease HII